MISVMITDQARYRIEYRLEGILCAVLECAELSTALDEIERKMRMDMGHKKGLTFHTFTGREL
jgi:hypothetical protein